MKQAGFSPEARWDRRMPDDSDPQDTSAIDVVALFKNAEIFPRAFALRGKKYEIKEVTYSWQERRGKETIVLFSVSTGADMYQISFNNTTFRWQLDKVIG